MRSRPRAATRRRGAHLALLALPLALAALGAALPAQARQQPTDAEPDADGGAPLPEGEVPPPDAPLAERGPEDLPPAEDGDRRGPYEYEDKTATPRPSAYSQITVDPKDPNRIFLATFDGFINRSLDGGKTWDEQRVLPELRNLFGAPGQVIFQGSIRGSRRLEGTLGLGTVRMPFGAGRAGAYAAGAEASAATSRGSNELDVGGGGRGGGAGTSDFGIGLSARAPRLSQLVARRGRPIAAINIKRTIGERGLKPTTIRRVILHPNIPNLVFACTEFGLYKSDDNGTSWVRAFTGINNFERHAVDLVVDPRDPNKMYLGTLQGLYLSWDGGNNWRKTTEQAVAYAAINHIVFDPSDPKYVYIATSGGLVRSNDGGQRWDWSYYTTFPAASVVRWVDIDPFDPNVGYIATHDGTFKTNDLRKGGLDSWDRYGGLQFSANWNIRLAACTRHKGHVYVMSQISLPTISYGANDVASLVSETWDDGNTWKVIFSPRTQGTIQWFEPEPQDPDLIWVVWSRSLHKMRRSDPRAAELARSEQILVPKSERQMVAEYTDGDPPMVDVLQATLRYNAVEVGNTLAFRRRSRLRALLPTLRAGWFHVAPGASSRLSDLAFGAQDRDRRASDYASDSYLVLAQWDLSDLVFNFESVLFGRIEGVNDSVRGTLMWAMHRYYGELQRLKSRTHAEPPTALPDRLYARLRIEELESFVNLFSGNYLERWRRGDHTSGWDVKAGY